MDSHVSEVSCIGFQLPSFSAAVLGSEGFGASCVGEVLKHKVYSTPFGSSGKESRCQLEVGVVERGLVHRPLMTQCKRRTNIH